MGKVQAGALRGRSTTRPARSRGTIAVAAVSGVAAGAAAVMAALRARRPGPIAPLLGPPTPSDAGGVTPERVQVPLKAPVGGPSAQGMLTGWYVDGSQPTWVLLVPARRHDRSAAFAAGLAAHNAGAPYLLTEPPTGMLGESGGGVDVEAVLRFARERGARDVVLYAFGDAAGACLAAARSEHWRDDVRGVVLDAPPLPWRAAMRLASGRLSGDRPLLVLPAGRDRSWLTAPGERAAVVTGFVDGLLSAAVPDDGTSPGARRSDLPERPDALEQGASDYQDNQGERGEPVAREDLEPHVGETIRVVDPVEPARE